MELVLVGSKTSPYVLKIRLFMMANQIAFEFKAINYLEKNDSNFLSQLNPVNKIPVLIINNQSLYESRVIFNYLNNTFLKSSLNQDEENILSCIDGLLDTLINLFMMKRSGINIASPGIYFERQHQRIKNLILHLESWAINHSKWDFLTMSFYSMIDWASFREMISLTSYPYLQSFLNQYNKSPFIQETKIIV